MLGSVVLAQGTLIPIPNRRDHVYDHERDILYVSTGTGLIERYDVPNEQLLPPIAVGGSTLGIDITPDARFLYIADQTIYGDNLGRIRKLDLDTGDVAVISFITINNEGGAFDLDIAGNGKGLISTNTAGAVWVPFREIDLATRYPDGTRRDRAYHPHLDGLSIGEPKRVLPRIRPERRPVDEKWSPAEMGGDPDDEDDDASGQPPHIPEPLD